MAQIDIKTHRELVSTRKLVGVVDENHNRSVDDRKEVTKTQKNLIVCMGKSGSTIIRRDFCENSAFVYEAQDERVALLYIKQQCCVANGPESTS